MKRGDIIFVQGKGIISKAVRFFDGDGTYSHVAIAISDKHVVEADYDTKVAVRLFDKDKYAVIDIIDLGLTHEQRNAIYEEALEMVGTKYDYISLLWYMLRKVFKLGDKNLLNNPNNVICSELVYLVLDKAGILDELGIKDSIRNGIDLTPNELFDLVMFASKK